MSNTNKPSCHRWKIYHDNLAAIQFRRTSVELNKPRYIGMTILNLSKLVMYDFHYKYILPKFPCANLLFTDIDSFCYKIPVDTNIEWFDFSNYPTDQPDLKKK